MAIRITINGKRSEIDGEVSIADFLRAKGVDESLVAVEHNLHWVRRDQWSSVAIRDGDRLEVIRIMAGG